MDHKPKNISIGVDEPVKPHVALVMGLQHSFAMSSTLVMAAVIVGAAGAAVADTQQLIRITMIVLGIATILQSLRRGPIGCGYLCPGVAGPGYLPASTLAASTGGISAIFGMLVIAGLFQMVIARFVNRLRAVMPPEVTGVIIAMVGISLIPVGVSLMAGYDHHDETADPLEAAVSVATIAIMYVLTIWGGQHLRTYSVLIGIVVGYLGALAVGVIPADSLQRWREAAWVGLPQFHAPWRLSFDMTLLVPFLIAGLAAAVKTIGVVSTCQRINDSSWSAPDMGSVRGGVFANGLSTILAGLAGGMAPSVSSSNVGLSLASGITSRWIGYSAGGLFILMAFSPLVTTVFVTMPAPVKGAILVYVACFIIVAGLQLVLAHHVSPRTTLIVGTSIIAGLSVDFLPEIYDRLPVWLHAFTHSPLAFATVVAIGLNLVFRIGIARRASLTIDLDHLDIDEVARFLNRCGADWGLRPDMVRQAIPTISDVLDVALADYQDRNVRLDARFDRTYLDLYLHYQGPPLEVPDDAPDPDDLAKDNSQLTRLSGYFVRLSATEVRQFGKGQNQVLNIRFAH
ncbi:MAG: solute carrier family 23 protein [Pseudomonadota bacterium]